MSQESEILLDIAKRLDDLSDELGAGELRTLAEEIGEIAAKWPDPSILGAPNQAEMPRWLYEIKRIVESEMRPPAYDEFARYRNATMQQMVNVPLPSIIAKTLGV